MTHQTSYPRYLWLGLILGLSLSTSEPAWSGEYFSEEVTSPIIEVIHGWRDTVGDRDVTVTNTSRGGIRVPMEMTGNDCGAAEMSLTNGRIQPLGRMEECSVNLFPFLDKLINQEVTNFRVSVVNDTQIIEVPISEVDRQILARVGNQSREAFLFFQEELARVLDLFRQAANPNVISAATPLPGAVATPTPQVLTTPNVSTAATVEPSAGTGGELVIVGQIQEEKTGAGSQLSVEAINPSEFAVIAAKAKFDFYRADQVIDTRTVAFEPSTVPPGAQATANVIKTDQDWDRVTVSFEWQRSSTP